LHSEGSRSAADWRGAAGKALQNADLENPPVKEQLGAPSVYAVLIVMVFCGKLRKGREANPIVATSPESE
jgi:hypothetical protein